MSHHLFALVEVPEHDDALAEGLLGGNDPCVELGLRGLAVFPRQLTLARCAGRDDIALRRSGSIARNRVEEPGSLDEVSVAGLALQRPRDDAVDLVVDGRVDAARRQGDVDSCHEVLDSGEEGWMPPGRAALSGPRSASSTSWL